MKKKQSLLELLQQNNTFINAPCGGKGTCKKCAVRFVKGATKPTEKDRDAFTAEQLEQGFRFACQAYPDGEYEVEVYAQEEKMEILSDWKEVSDSSGDLLSKEEGFGIAFDIGTTTLAAVLVHLSTGEACKTLTSVNHQRIYGADVITRIQASNDGKKWEMQRCIRQDIKRMISELAKRQDIDWQEIKKIVIAGNTTMCHLLCGYSCEALGSFPFQPVNIALMTESAKTLLGLRDLDAKVMILPGISAFVGADIVAGILACHLRENKKYKMLLDIGTNGEMVLANQDELYVTSAAAGPALEGGNISCGMACIPGAIAHVGTDANGILYTEVIGGGNAVGICGSGMIDLLYELKKNGKMDEQGTLCDTFFASGYPITEHLKFYQKDIRELQMAKSAIRAGIDILIKKAKIQWEDIEVCYLAGGFGAQINIENAAAIGLLPKELKEKTVPVGNTSLSGAVLCLKNKVSKTELEEIGKAATDINLATETEFEALYLKYLALTY